MAGGAVLGMMCPIQGGSFLWSGPNGNGDFQLSKKLSCQKAFVAALLHCP